MNELQTRISEIGVVPVIKLNHPQRDAAGLAQALVKGGVPVAEVTFRAAGAADAIRIMQLIQLLPALKESGLFALGGDSQ